MNQPTHKDLKPLRTFAQALPSAQEDFPFGHSVMKIGKKVFAFLGQNEEGQATIAVKLPESRSEAMLHKCAAPTGYGLGRSGWVTISLGCRDTPPKETLYAWITESYRAIAPKKLAAQLDAPPAKRAAQKQTLRTKNARR